ncbi:hypothetical protein OIDMADRAFT_181105 [Oidiodendron maius Zn]|uniref:F-box domain-containing protein n=1 Tax=Oidiodendron maius (strain Zn) TaxID=913774 RepID=A0A0C3H8U8_OIDMZ|nr:hypothetical protein OIDMADRAFT_181105 [Oidiodendron maius Zn]
MQLQASITMHMPACVICGDEFYAAHSTDRSSAPWNAWFRVGRCLNSFVFFFFFPALCLSNTSVNTRRRAKVTADPGIYGPTLSEVGYYKRSGPVLVQLPNGDAFELSPFDGRDSFIMHANCYSLLAQFWHPQPVPVARLLKACCSCVFLPNWRGLLSWGPGHDYGGIIGLRNKYPWDEPDDFNGEGPVRIRRSDDSPEDPWSKLKLVTTYLERSRLDGSATQTKGKRSRKARRSIRKPSARGSERFTTVGNIISNYFTKLPHEIFEFILTYTPTDGVKSLARTSKGLNIIIPSGLGQSFWASRFQDPFEYGYVFEAQTYGVRFDWKALYFCIKKGSSPRLKNRRRIWRLIQSLSELLCVQWKGDQGLLPLDRDQKELKWKEVHGLIEQPKRRQNLSRFWASPICNRLYSQCTSIPSVLCRIVVSTVSSGTATYITGLCFISNQETEISLGYKSKRGSSLEMTGLQGFIIAVGSRGIHAIQFVTPTGQLSQWFGNPKGMPITRRLASCKPITALKGGFDGFKMVSLAIAEASSPMLNDQPNETISLRDSALWFPYIPETDLQLSETDVRGFDNASSGFRPLCCLFGDVANPTVLSKVLVTLSDNRVVDIHCYYATEGIRTLSSVSYLTSATRTLGYLVKRAAGENKDTISFVHNRELREPKTHFTWSIGLDNMSRRRPSLLSPLAIPSESSLAGLYVKWEDGLFRSLGAMTKYAPARTRSVTRGTPDLSM